VRNTAGTRYHVGTSGFSYDNWTGVLYPEGLPRSRRLEHYVTRFNTVELNYPFYRLPRKSTVESWRAKAPKGFLYAVKASRFLTHVKRLQDPAGPLRNLYEVFEAFGDTLGPILFQLPPNLSRDDGRLDGFLRALSGDHRHAVEFRHRSWFAEPVYERLERARVAVVSVSSPDIRTGVLATGPFLYLRFHGERKMFHTRYTRPHLERYAAEVRRVLKGRRKGTPIFVYFNNDAKGAAPVNAGELAEILG